MKKNIKNSNRKYHLGIHGSRTLSDERVKIIILEEIAKHNPTTIITHAEPGGVCALVQKLCRELAIPLKVHFLNFKYLRGAFEHRSIDVIRDSDYSVFIHDGVSKGTMNELTLAKKMKAPYSFYELEPTEYKQSVGFEIEEEWGDGITDGKELLA